MDVLKANAQGDVYLTDGKNVYFIPQDWPTQVDEENGTEIWCYAPTHIRRNSTIDILWVPVRDLNKLRRITKKEARRIHPALFRHLAKIDRNEPEVTGACTCDVEVQGEGKRCRVVNGSDGGWIVVEAGREGIALTKEYSRYGHAVDAARRLSRGGSQARVTGDDLNEIEARLHEAVEALWAARRVVANLQNCGNIPGVSHVRKALAPHLRYVEEGVKAARWIVRGRPTRDVGRMREKP